MKKKRKVTPAQLEFIQEAEKKARSSMATMQATYAPLIKVAQAQMEQSLNSPAIRAMIEMNTEPQVMYAPASSRYHDAPHVRQSNTLIYDKKTQVLAHEDERTKPLRFSNARKNNKRKKTFETLLRAKKVILTKDLAERLLCKEKQVQNTVRWINRNAKSKLRLNEKGPLIISPGSGYTINPTYYIDIKS